MTSRSAAIIKIPLPLPLASLPGINAYLIKADPVTLIDTGLKHEGSMETLCRVLNENNLQIEDIKRIIITHGHIDHFGMAEVIREKSAAEIFISEEDVPKVNKEYSFTDNKQSLNVAGMPQKTINSLHHIEDMMRIYCDILDNFTAIKNDHLLEFDGFCLKTMLMPGHSIGHTCLYWPGRNVLFSGDMILPKITTIPIIEETLPNEEHRYLSLASMIDSLKKLLKLDINYILPGHGDTVTDPGDLIKSRIQFYLKRLEEMYFLLKSTGPQNPYELAKLYFKGVMGFDLLLAVCETAVNLELLVHQERATEETNDGITYFRSC